MRSESAVWITAAVVVLAFGILLGSGASGATIAIIAILGGILALSIGSSMAVADDASWLPRWVAIGYILKLGGTAARYYMVTVLYGYGDSYGYYQTAVRLAEVWRNGDVPGLTGHGSLGTQIVEAFTGGLFTIVQPDLLGGFLLFAIIAFMGQLLLYAAFRRHAKPHHLKPYAMLIFLLPTFAFWPSSIGKDALVLFGLGACAYFVARSLEAFEVRWLVCLAFSLLALGLVRVHIAGLVVGAFAVAALVSRVPTRGDPAIMLRRLITLGAGVAIAIVVIGFFPDIFGVDLLNAQDRDGFTADIVRRTSESGTVAAGDPASSPLDIPEALVYVLYRPFIFEATETQHLFAAAETSLLVLLTLLRLPTVIRNLGRWRSNPYVVFSTVYMLAFAFAFSAIRNLGIIARQRGQVLAFFLCVIVYLGWKDPEPETSQDPYVAALAVR
jgi:hypothetical protein